MDTPEVSLDEDGLSFRVRQKVHKNCQREYTRPWNVNQYVDYSNEPATPNLRSNEQFRFSDHCLFYAEKASVNERKQAEDSYHVRTDDFLSP